MKNEEILNHVSQTIYHDIDPKTIEDDDLVHIEVDPDGNSHVWPTEPGMGNQSYHPKWDAHWKSVNGF